MNRGDRREPIFKDDVDRKRFLETLAKTCGKTEWQVHAFCLMANRFQLALRLRRETVMTLDWIAERLHRGCRDTLANCFKAARINNSRD